MDWTVRVRPPGAGSVPAVRRCLREIGEQFQQLVEIGCRVGLPDAFVELAGIQAALGEVSGEPVDCCLPVTSAGAHPW